MSGVVSQASPRLQVQSLMDCKRAVCHQLSSRLFSAEKGGVRVKNNSPIVPQSDHWSPIMKVSAAFALSSSGPYQKAIE